MFTAIVYYTMFTYIIASILEHLKERFHKYDHGLHYYSRLFIYVSASI